MNERMLSDAIKHSANKLAMMIDTNGMRLYAQEAELLIVLSRIVAGAQISKAFGRQERWGLDRPIGKALAAEGDKQ